LRSQKQTVAVSVTAVIARADLRGTAVTRLSEADCSLQEIATITGHSLRDVGAIIDRYSGRTDKLAQSAMAKLERART
jgi:hypothetical protein